MFFKKEEKYNCPEYKKENANWITLGKIACAINEIFLVDTYRCDEFKEDYLLKKEEMEEDARTIKRYINKQVDEMLEASLKILDELYDVKKPEDLNIQN